MAKWYGAVGYVKTVESKPGVWTEQVVERMYSGDLNRINRRLQTANQLNDNVNVANEISILADPFAYENFQSIRYVEFMGCKWKISDIEVQYPRLRLTVGGLYNGK